MGRYSGDPWEVGDQSMIAGNNLIVGTVNIRQKRVKRASCSIPQQFLAATEVQDCIADFSSGVEVWHPAVLERSRIAAGRVTGVLLAQELTMDCVKLDHECVLLLRFHA